MSPAWHGGPQGVAARNGRRLTSPTMLLKGSCQCGKVRFTVESETPYPFMNCYCSICRKLTGGPYGCNIMGKRPTLKVTGSRFLREYHARLRKAGARTRISGGQRMFCGECGTHLYVLDDQWPEGVWPSAAAIDTPLPVPPERVHLMVNYKPDWVPIADKGPRFAEYPKLSIAQWHEQHGLTQRDESRASRGKAKAPRARRSTR